MSVPNMDDLKSSKDESSSEEPDTTEVSEEVRNAPTVNIRPESAIAFEEIVSFGFTGDVDYVQNLKGTPLDEDGNTTPEYDYGGTIAVTVRGPTVSGGQLWKSTDDGQSADYRLVGPETTSLNTREIDGEEHVFGIEYGDRTFDAEQLDDFDVEYVTLYFNGGLGEYIARRIDAGGGFSYNDDDVEANFDEPVPLMEYPSDDSDQDGAVRRPPILRGDFHGGGAIMFEVNDSGAFMGSVFMENEDGEYIDLHDRAIDSMDHEGYLDTSAVYIGNFAWEEHGSADDESRSADTPSEETSDDTSSEESVDDVDDLNMDFSEEDEGSLTYDDLDGNWQTFVDNISQHISSGKVDREKLIPLAENFVDDNEPVEWGEVSRDDIESIVDEKAE